MNKITHPSIDISTLKNDHLFTTPILFTIFNNPDTTGKVFEVIKKIKPTKLYIAADGARVHKVGEFELCVATRKVTENIDWPCEVYRKYSDTNLGCKISMSSAITWFFENIEEGIILEDDCVPDMSFFTFCQELLEKYKNVDKVKMISGNNFQFGKKYGEESYYFSNFPSIWGWATWRRAWKDFDIDMKTYPLFKKDKKIESIFKNKTIQKFMLGLFDKLYKNEMNTWAGRWVYAIYDKDGVSITPNVNLVSNIGFNESATHTKSRDDILGNIPSHSISKITHPLSITINTEADNNNFKNVFYRSILTKIFSKMKKYFTI